MPKRPHEPQIRVQKKTAGGTPSVQGGGMHTSLVAHHPRYRSSRAQLHQNRSPISTTAHPSGYPAPDTWSQKSKKTLPKQRFL
jgi:hypothetical protein